jgi:NAD(P)-dependent dehydrogenase (short-subunit alcohol dehydrogenase family)
MRVYGRIDILMNNAATNHFEEFETFPDEAIPEWLN